MQLSVVSARLSVCKSVSLDGWEGRLACLKHLFFLFWILAALSESADGQSVSCLGALRESLQLQSAKAHQILKWQNIQSSWSFKSVFDFDRTCSFWGHNLTRWGIGFTF